MRLYLNKKEAILVKIALAMEMVNMTDEQKQFAPPSWTGWNFVKSSRRVRTNQRTGFNTRFTWEPGGLPGCQVNRTGHQ